MFKDFVQGEDRTISVTVTDSNDEPVTITRCIMTARTAVDATTIVFEKDTDVPAEGALTDAANGEAEFYIVPADTDTAEAGNLTIDIWAVASGKRYRVKKDFEVELEATPTKSSQF